MSEPESLSLDGFDLGAALGIPEPKPGTPAKTAAPEQGGIKVSHRMGARQLWRKAASEKALEDAIDWHWREGDSYHCFSFGDVDSFSFFKMVLRQQPIRYAAISTWCMAGEDVIDLRKWHERGLVGRVDFFMGEIFKGSYPDVYAATKEFIAECGGRLVIFRNHSKVMAIEGERFDCLIESSANVNTFQSTPPTRGATAVLEIYRNYMTISIHAPHTGGDWEPATAEFEERRSRT